MRQNRSKAGVPNLLLLSVLAFTQFALPLAEAAKLRLGVKTGLKYDPIALHVRPGEKVELLFDNGDEMMHNFALVSPGSRMELVEAAIALGADGPARHFVPDSPKVLVSTPVVLPGKKVTILFDAPEKEGEYPYVCTFPGHGFVMFGTLFVYKERSRKMDELLAQTAAETSTQSALASPATSAVAVVHRTFMPDCSPAGIAVSLPGGHSYCWDAGNCRLRYAWRDGFIKKNGSFGRWRTLPHIVGRVYHRELRFPFHFAGKHSEPVETKFRGYRLLGGIPEFRYEVDGTEVTEFLAKLPGKSGLARRFTVKNAPVDLLFHLDPDDGVEITCDKGRIDDGAIRLTPKEAKNFTLTLREIPRQAPVFYLSMNDLEVSYNRKGSLFEGAVGQAWQMTGGRRIIPTQTKGDYSQGATLAVWVKLTDPSRPIPALIGWEKGGTLRYAATTKAFSFGSTSQDLEEPGNGLEAELAKFKGPKRTSANAGYRGSGYLDFGDAPGQFVEWMVKVEKAGEHRLRFRYASGDSRPLELSVDGKTDLLAPTLPFSGTSSWTSWKYAEAKRNLSPGKHLIRLTSGKKKGPNIDSLEVIGPDDKRERKPELTKTVPAAGKPVWDDAWHLVTVTID
ncbi:MAG: carbohydrate-binding protein, partial [Opitutales bacterium]